MEAGGGAGSRWWPGASAAAMAVTAVAAQGSWAVVAARTDGGSWWRCRIGRDDRRSWRHSSAAVEAKGGRSNWCERGSGRCARTDEEEKLEKKGGKKIENKNKENMKNRKK